MKNLKRLRSENKLSQADLAKILDISQTAIHFWETGQKEASCSTAEKIAKYFNVTVDYLLGLEDNSGVTYPQRFIEVSDTEKQLIAEFRKSRHNAHKFLIDLEDQERNKK